MSPQSRNASLVRIKGVLILALGFFLAFLAYKAVSRLVREPQTPLLRAVVAVEDVAPGDLLVSRKLQAVTRPANEIPSGAFTRMEHVTGRIAARPIGKGDFVTNDHLMPEVPSANQSVAGWLSPGQRAIAIKVDEASGISGALNPGDTVDVIATSALAGGRENQVSRVVLEKIKVLSVLQEKRGSLFPGSSDRTGRVTSVILAVNPDEANVLAACEGARLRLVARSGKGSGGVGEEYIYIPSLGPKRLSDLERIWAEKDLDFNRRIPGGMRAVTVRVSREDGICGQFFPGNKVDVIAVTMTGDLAREGAESGRMGTRLETSRLARTILQNVELMAVEDELDSLPGGQQGGGEDWLATLLLTPTQAERLIAVTYDGGAKFKIVRRNPQESEIVDTQGIKILDVFFKPEELVYEVEIHRGGRVDVESFSDVRVP